METELEIGPEGCVPQNCNAAEFDLSYLEFGLCGYNLQFQIDQSWHKTP